MFVILLAIYNTVGKFVLSKLSFAGRQGLQIQMKTSSHNVTDVTLCIAANISKRNFAWIMERDIPVFHLPYDNGLLTHPTLEKKIAICTFVGFHILCGVR